MKNFLLQILFLTSIIGSVGAQVIITGVFDGPLPGGLPKGVELYVTQDIADLSVFGLGSANNGQGTDGIEFTFPAASAVTGDFIYVTNDSIAFVDFFEFTADYVAMDAVNINGDDAIELFMNDAVIDVFGDIDTDGSGTAWEYLDGWAYRNDGVMANGGTFSVASFYYSGINVFDGQTTNATSPTPFPFGTYVSTMPTTVSLVDDALTMSSDLLSLNINSIFGNDFIPGDPTLLGFPVLPTNGTISIDGLDLIYTKNSEEFCGEDTFTYNVCIGADCDTATVNITIECPIDYPSYTISEVTTVNADGIVDSLDVTCSLTGIVYGVNLRPSGLQFTIIDANNNGIAVFNNSGDLGYTVMEGDEVTVTGSIFQYNGLTQMSPDGVTLISQDNSLISPMALTNAIVDDNESSLVSITNIENVVYNSGGSGDNYDITYDGGLMTTMRMDNDVEGYGSEIGPFISTITGICGQFDSSAPYDEGYQILPRYLADVTITDAVKNLADKWGLKAAPSIFNEVLYLSTDVDVDQIQIVNLNGQVVFSQKSPSGTVQINSTDFAAGMYFVLATKDSLLGVLKVMKQ